MPGYTSKFTSGAEIDAVLDAANTHVQRTDNPHQVTAAQTGAISAIGTALQYACVSSDSGMNILFGENCCLDTTGSYKYLVTHDSLGARGIVFSHANGKLYFFETGSISTTADLTFAPVLQEIYINGGSTDVPISDGGTGASTAAAAMYNLINGASAITPDGTDLLPFLDVSGNTSGYVTMANLLSALQGIYAGLIYTGSYTGNGSYGSSNANSIICPFDPKYVLIKQQNVSQPYYRLELTSVTNLSATAIPMNTSYNQTATITATYTAATKKVSWYSTFSQGQLNLSGTVYDYVIWG